jgi:hypothetical protein
MKRTFLEAASSCPQLFICPAYTSNQAVSGSSPRPKTFFRQESPGLSFVDLNH